MHFFINDYEEVLFLTNIIIIIIIIIIYKYTHKRFKLMFSKCCSHDIIEYKSKITFSFRGVI